jgi:DNA-binding NarL/FixJ family response regulator
VPRTSLYCYDDVPMNDIPRPRLLVVDDHPVVLGAVAEILNRKFDVVGMENSGAAGVDASARLHPDAIVLDIAMPGLDGFQTAARIRKAGSTARIVFLSNFTGEDYVLAGIAQGASAFVTKPRMEADLLPAVDHALAGRTFLPSAAALPRWRERTSRPHDLQIYATDAFLVDSLMTYFENALETGDSLISIASKPHRRALEDSFAARGVDVAALEASGRYTVVDSLIALDAILVNGVPDGERFTTLLDSILQRAVAASTAPVPHATMFGEIAPILCARGQYDATLQVEQMADDFVAARPLSLLCGYSTACVHDPNVLSSICAKHDAIVPADPA